MKRKRVLALSLALILTVFGSATFAREPDEERVSAGISARILPAPVDLSETSNVSAPPRILPAPAPELPLGTGHSHSHGYSFGYGFRFPQDTCFIDLGQGNRVIVVHHYVFVVPVGPDWGPCRVP